MNILNKWVLKRLLRKRAKDDFIPLGSRSAIFNDYVSIWFYAPDEMEYQLLDIDGGRLKAVKGSRVKEFNFREVNINSFNVYYYCRLWRLHYKDIYTAFLYAVIPLKKIEWHYSKNDAGYIVFSYTKEEVLKELVSLAQPTFGKIDFYDLLRKIYGPQVENRTDYEPHTALRFVLNALQESGELTLEGTSQYINKIQVEPKALNTISAYELSTRLHNEALSQSRAVKWLTVILAIIGIVQAIAAWKSTT